MKILQKKSQTQTSESNNHNKEAELSRLVSARLQARRKAFMLQEAEVQDE